MSDVVSFNDLSTQDIAAYQLGLPRIVLEGGSDVRLFEQYWFGHLIDTFDFVAAGAIVGGNGCTAVNIAVEKSRADNIPAFGIVDRDHLFRARQWADLFEVDSTAFAARTRDAHMYTTSRWEIEAYLLEPHLLPAWVRSYRAPPGSDAQCSSAVAGAIEEAEQLLRAIGFFATAHTIGRKCPAKYFVDVETGALVSAASAALAGLEADEGAAREVEALVDAVLTQAPTESHERLRWLLCYVDTKRLIYRLTRRYAAKSDVIWFFAELMKQGNARPRELEERLTELQRRVNS